jgi:hypothetical protein
MVGMESTTPAGGFDPARFAVPEDHCETAPGAADLLGRRGLPYTHSDYPVTSHVFRWWGDGQRPYALALLSVIAAQGEMTMVHAVQILQSGMQCAERRAIEMISALASCGLVGRWLEDPQLREESDDWRDGWSVCASQWGLELVDGRLVNYRPPVVG